MTRSWWLLLPFFCGKQPIQKRCYVFLVSFLASTLLFTKKKTLFCLTMPISAKYHSFTIGSRFWSFLLLLLCFFTKRRLYFALLCLFQPNITPLHLAAVFGHFYCFYFAFSLKEDSTLPHYAYFSQISLLYIWQPFMVISIASTLLFH